MPGAALARSEAVATAAARRGWRRALAWARAALCALAIAAVALGCGLRVANARLGEALLGFGGELTRFQDLRAHSRPRQLDINGMSLGVMSLSTELEVNAALDRFQLSCRKRGGLAVPEGLSQALGDGSFRQESPGQGVLACLDSGRPLELSELAERLQRFRQSGDLAALGELRYVLARRSGKVTTLLVLWTEGSAPLLGLFPKTGDAPGRDLEGVPRPPDSRRLLFAAEQGAPYALAAYRAASLEPSVMVERYRASLRTVGFTVESSPTPGVLRAQRAGKTLVVNVSPGRQGGSLLTLSRLD